MTKTSRAPIAQLTTHYEMEVPRLPTTVAEAQSEVVTFTERYDTLDEALPLFEQRLSSDMPFMRAHRARLVLRRVETIPLRAGAQVFKERETARVDLRLLRNVVLAMAGAEMLLAIAAPDSTASDELHALRKKLSDALPERSKTKPNKKN